MTLKRVQTLLSFIVMLSIPLAVCWFLISQETDNFTATADAPSRSARSDTSRSNPPASARKDSTSSPVPVATAVEASPEVDVSSAADTPTFDIESDNAIEDRIAEAVEYLASDELEGRGPKTAGLDKAADYIAAEFSQAGLQTDAYGGTPFHVFSKSRRLAMGTVNRAQIVSAQHVHDMELAVDFTPLSVGASAEFDLPLAWMGYGISAPDLNYDDYADLDVTGRAVVLLRHEPQQDSESSIFNGSKNSVHAFIDQKISTAIAHGAAAVILCTDLHALSQRKVSRDATQQSDPLLKFNVRSKLRKREIPVLHCRRQVIDQMLSRVGESDLETLESEIDADLKPRSFLIDGHRLTGSVSVVEQTRSLKNVVAVLPGDGPHADETVVIGAHYDHLGMGGGGGSLAPWTFAIHNGADDNASGTAALLEIARQVKQRSGGNSRRIVFIAFSAEEMGLVGSERYVRDPLFPLSKTIAMVNLDMVGRLRDSKLTVFGTGTAVEFDSLVTRLGEEHSLRVRKSPGGYGPSDHASFYGRGIPVLHFFTGFHPEYHRPSDDFDTINVPGIRQVAGMATDIVLQLATADSIPQRRGSDFSFDELVEDAAPRSTPSGKQKPYLGVHVTKKEDAKGLTIQKILGKSPAARAQLRVGDVIERVNDVETHETEELIKMIREFDPGAEIRVVVRRGNALMEFEIRLAD